MSIQLTTVGLSKLQNSMVDTNSPLIITKMGIGDWNGDETSDVDITRSELVSLKYKNGIGSKKVTDDGLELLMVIPTTVGGFTIREVGLYDQDDVLIAIGRHATTIKTSMSEAPSILDMYILLNISNDSPVDVVFDNDTQTVSSTVFDASIEDLSDRTVNGVGYMANQQNIDLETRLAPSDLSKIDDTYNIGAVGLGDYLILAGGGTVTSFGTVGRVGMRRDLCNRDSALSVVSSENILTGSGVDSIVHIPINSVITVLSVGGDVWRIINIYTNDGGLSTAMPKNNNNSALVGTSKLIAREDHAHKLPEFADILEKPTTLEGYGIETAILSSENLNNITKLSIMAQPDINKATSVLKYPVMFPGVLITAPYGVMVYQSYHANSNISYSRSRISGEWTDWKVQANTDSNVASATKLKTGRSIRLEGDVDAVSILFDGGGDKTMIISVKDDSHGHSFQTIDGLESALDNIIQTFELGHGGGVNADMLDDKHASEFAGVNHNHNTIYATLNHNHNSVYATLNHNHNSTYAAVTHDHNAVAGAMKLHTKRKIRVKIGNGAWDGSVLFDGATDVTIEANCSSCSGSCSSTCSGGCSSSCGGCDNGCWDNCNGA